MVTVFVQKMILISGETIAQVLNEESDILTSEVSKTHLDGRSVKMEEENDKKRK